MVKGNSFEGIFYNEGNSREAIKKAEGVASIHGSTMQRFLMPFF
jgi:hypothetical protein